MPKKRKIKGFEIENQLGEGGFGTVYLAADPRLNRQVALKVLTQTSTELREGFLREARITADIRHPNVVEIYQLIEDKDYDYIVMEYCSGGDLLGLLGEPSPVELVAWISRQFLSGIQAAHEKYVIHRDLKPQNLLLTDKTENPTVKVTDFGIAGLISNSTATRGTTGTSGFVGPEQDYEFLKKYHQEIVQAGYKDGYLPHGVETDVFAAGTLIWSLLTGSWPPISFTEEFGEEFGTVSYRLPDPREVNPSVPAHWVDAINQCREVFPSNRFSSFIDLYNALGLDGPPVIIDSPKSGDLRTAANTDIARDDLREAPDRHEYAIGPIRIRKQSGRSPDPSDPIAVPNDFKLESTLEATNDAEDFETIKPGTLSSVAGRGLRGRTGDGGPSSRSALNHPTDVVLKSSDDVYIADFGNHRIRVIDARSNTINTLVGRYGAGFSGDGSICEEAKLNGPSNLANHPDGSLYIADSNNQRIRRIDSQTRVISTVVGNENPPMWNESQPASNASIGTPFALAISASGTLYFCEASELGANTVIAYDGPNAPLRIAAGIRGRKGFSEEQGFATELMLDEPTAIAVHGDNALFIADSKNHRIRKVDLATGFMSTYAGTGVAGFSGDGEAATNACLGTVTKIALDNFGNLWFFDSGVGGSTGARIRKIDSLTNVITTEIGGGTLPPSEGALIKDINLPTGALAIHESGRVYVAATSQHRIWQADVPRGDYNSIGSPELNTESSTA